MPAIKLFIPSEMFNIMYKMFYEYGCSTYTIVNKKVISTKRKMSRKQNKKRKHKTCYLWMKKLKSTEEIFAPWRFNRTIYLVRQNFAGKIAPGTRRKELQYDSHAVVCIIVKISITMIFDIHIPYRYKNTFLSF